VIQVVTNQYVTLKQQLNTTALTAAEKKSDMNGRLVSNGHPKVNGGQTTDHSIGSANGHLDGHANGHTVGQNHSSVTDTAHPMFSKTASVNSVTQNAEVSTTTVLTSSGGATLWQSSANALPVCCHALPVALPIFYMRNKKAKLC